jgi:hypothetical protein
MAVGEVAGADDTGKDSLLAGGGNHILARTQQAEELGPHSQRERWE